MEPTRDKMLQPSRLPNSVWSHLGSSDASAPATFDVLLTCEAHVSLYAYNDVLLRTDDLLARSLLTEAMINEQPTHLQLDGIPAIGQVEPPRVVLYGHTAHYTCLHLGEMPTTALADRPPVESAAVFGLADGEAPRKVTLLVRRCAPASPSDLDMQ